MTMKTSELFRLLPKIAHSECYQVDQASILINQNNHSLLVKYHEKENLKIGALKLPQLQLEFRFSGYTENEADDFIKKFDTIFRRGGG